MDERQSIVFRRMTIENRLESAVKLERAAKSMREGIESDLFHLQRECPHLDVDVSSTWQGGGLYYDIAHCKDCNKKGDRYNRARTMEESKKWYKDQYDEEKHAPKYSGFMGEKRENDW